MPMTLRTAAAAILCLGVTGARLHADVVKLAVEKREPFASQGQAYEKLTGRFFGELDPKHPLNAIITDIEHAPRNARGLVEYSATFTILKPVDMSKGTGVLVYQVPNRGRANIEGGAYFADFRARGHVIVASGWQADIRPGLGIESLVIPIAKHADGSSITGPVMARVADAEAGSNTQPIIRGRVTGTATPASLDTTKATLTRRLSEEGSRVPLRADEWAFADCTKTAFPGHPDPEKLCLKGGFDPAALYELTYVAKDPPVHGIGFAATRDLIAFLRQGAAASPLGAAIRHTIAQGNSQSGNYLRSFLNLGFNQDEAGRRVFDGMNPNIAARQRANRPAALRPRAASV